MVPFPIAMVSITAKRGTMARPVEKNCILSTNDTEESDGDIVSSSILERFVLHFNGNVTG